MTPMEDAVLSTLAYFAQFRRALTLSELHQYLWQKDIFHDAILDVVRRMPETIFVGNLHNEPLYGISKDSIEVTKTRQGLLAERREIALKIGRVLQKVPGIKAGIVMNGLAMQTIRASSDLDVLVIVEPGHLYSARSIAMLHLDWRGLSKSKRESSGRACLGYWLDSDHLSVKKYQTEPRTAAYWIATMVPLFGLEYYQKFINKNSWVKNDLPNWEPHEMAHLDEIENRESRIHNFGRFYRYKTMEDWLHKASRWRVMTDAAFRESKETVCEPHTLKLHTIDKRPEYGRKMQSILDILSHKH